MAKKLVIIKLKISNNFNKKLKISKQINLIKSNQEIDQIFKLEKLIQNYKKNQKILIKIYITINI